MSLDGRSSGIQPAPLAGREGNGPVGRAPRGGKGRGWPGGGTSGT